MYTADNDTITIKPKNPESKWVALDQENNIIAEGEEPGDVIEDAKQTKKEYTLMFVPQEGNTYLF